MKNPIDKELAQIIQDMRLDNIEKRLDRIEKPDSVAKDDDEKQKQIPPRPEPMITWYTNV